MKYLLLGLAISIVSGVYSEAHATLQVPAAKMPEGVTAGPVVMCRDAGVKQQFDKEQEAKGIHKAGKGYIVDHICALQCGGKDITANMQYQTKEESKDKDRWEGTAEGCKKTCTPENSTYPLRNVYNCK